MCFSSRAVTGTLLLCLTTATSLAQSVTPQEELRAYVGMKGKVPLPDAGAFGEQFNPLTGELQLVQTDAWLRTNSFPLLVTRSFTPGSVPAGTRHTGAFGDWQLELPRITTLTVRDSDGHGWKVAGNNPNARCSTLAPPPTMMAAQLLPPGSNLGADWGSALNPNAIDPNVWWQGYQLIVPGQGEQEVLVRDAKNTLAPQMTAADGSSMRFPLVTAQQWQISCLGQTDNGEPGEAFFAVAPDGTKYTFNHLVYQDAPSLSLDSAGTITRQRASMLVTRIEDRFGNVQQFVYDGDRLITVTNPNEMQLDLKYRTDVPTLIDQIILRPYTANPRKWTYQYANLGSGRETLTDVIRPDGAAWSYSLQALVEARLTYNGNTTCSAVAPFDTKQTFSGSMSDPNGLTERLTFAGVRRSRALVMGDCTLSTRFPWKPAQFDTLSLVQRSYSGTNVGAPSWNYHYEGEGGMTEIMGPDQNRTDLFFSPAADGTEGQLQILLNSGGTGSRLRDVRFRYATPNLKVNPYPVSLGTALGSRVNSAAMGDVRPLTSQTITQDGDTYTTEWKAFNAFAQPIQIRRSNNATGQVLETRIDYLNDLPHWMLGLPQTVTNVADNTVISQNVYDSAQVTLKETYRFGLKQASYTYDAQGHLTSIADGNGLTTQYQNYVMGNPITTAYADGTKEESWPDNFGNIGTHIDRDGVTTTAEYDSVDRITHTHIPSSDGVSWNDTYHRYLYVDRPETGVAGAHWRYGISRGESDTIIDHDALMRPYLRSSRYGPVSASPYINQAQAYDWRGRTVFASYPSRDSANITQLTQGVHTEYDALGRPVASRQDSEQGVLTTALAYLKGARIQVTDPKGAVTTMSYQVFDKPSTASLLSIAAPEDIHQTITRDTYGLPLTLAQSGLYQNGQLSLVRQYYYDEHKRVCRTVEPETGSTVVDYDAGSRVIWTAQGLSINGTGCGREQVADAAKTRHTYDTMDRLLSVAYPAGTLSSQFTYDAMGRVTSADTGLSRWTYAYNGLGLPTSETLVVDGLPYTLSYGYDANGSLASTTYPDGRTIDYAPDAWGRPTQAGSFANAARYLPSGELEYFKYGNGIEYVTEQNARQLPRNLSYALPNGNLLFSQDFSYDKNGNLTQANDLLQGVGSQRQFGYDTLNRLTRATLPGAIDSESYSYDPLNNLRHITADTGLVRDYQYDPLNRLSNAVGSDGQTHSFAYDNRGNTIQRDSTPLTFDLANRLTEVSGRESYVYDAFGRRVLKTRLGVGGNKTYYVYSNQTGQLMLQRDNDVASSETDYIYLGGKLVAQATTHKQDLPGAITFTPGSPTDGIYTIAWGTTGGASTYELEEQLDGGSWTQIYRGSATSYTIPGWDWERLGGTYLYRLRACGNTCGEWVISSPMGVTPQTIDGRSFVLPEGAQRGAYRVAWTPTYSATLFDVDEGVARNGATTWVRVATDLTTPYVDRPGGRIGAYRYRVAARNAYGRRFLWGQADHDVIEDPSESGPPEEPTIAAPSPGMILVGKWPFRLRVMWNGVGRVTRYEVDISQGFAHCSTQATECTFNIDRQGDYVISVRACNDQGCSPWRIQFVTLVPQGGVPTSTSTTPINGTPTKEGQP